MRTHTLAAVAVAALGSAAFAVDIPVTGGTLETGSPAGSQFGAIGGWNNLVPGDEGQTGVFTSYAGYTPANASRADFLNSQGANRVLLPTQLFRMQAARFDYLSRSGDPAAASLAGREAFRVNLGSYGQGGDLLGVQGSDTDSGVTSATSGIVGASGETGTAEPPTGFAFMNLDPGFVDPSVYFAEYEFVAYQGGTSGVSTLQIEDVVINPEPGTMALFGLGAAGLGTLVWRRRKSKKPA